MNSPMQPKMSFLTLPPYIEYQASDKRNRNPNWTDAEISRFLTILMEDAVLQDLNAQRNKQVFCYVSQKMCSEGSEKSWDQCRVKLKNLKSQWRYVKERMPGIEIADLEEDDVIRQLTAESQACGVSPSCIKHLRLLKQFLNCLAAVRKGVSPPRYRGHDPMGQGFRLGERFVKVEYNDDNSYDDNTDDGLESRLVVETSVSPPTSPGHGGGDGGGPYGGAVGEGSVDGGHSSHGTGDSGYFQGLKIISPSDINSGQHKKREMLEEGEVAAKKIRLSESSSVDSPNPASQSPCTSQPLPLAVTGETVRQGRDSQQRKVGDTQGQVGDSQHRPSESGDSQRQSGEPARQAGGILRTANIVTEKKESQINETVENFQRDMVDKYLQFQRESEMRFLSWEQERWRLEQSCMERWRSEHRQHEKEMFSMFCQLMAQCNQAITATLAATNNK